MYGCTVFSIPLSVYIDFETNVSSFIVLRFEENTFLTFTRLQNQVTLNESLFQGSALKVKVNRQKTAVIHITQHAGRGIL